MINLTLYCPYNHPVTEVKLNFYSCWQCYLEKLNRIRRCYGKVNQADIDQGEFFTRDQCIREKNERN